MGETTGIVSVPDEDNASAKGQQVSFEGKVYDLEKYYKAMYDLCRGNVDSAKVADMAADFAKFFSLEEYRVKSDFEFLQSLRLAFDTAFKNSVSPQCSGYSVDGSDVKVMRFNSANSVFVNCGAKTCDSCPNKQYCRSKTVAKRNISSEFASSVRKFFTEGEKFYSEASRKYQEYLGSIIVGSGAERSRYEQTRQWFKTRESAFTAAKSKMNDNLRSISDSSESFTVPFETYQNVFAPMKKLYWDEIVANYINMILAQFYKQCDSVLQSAGLFEKFIKTLSIADFMNNMEGNV
jgi:hypothetical protein